MAERVKLIAHIKAEVADAILSDPRLLENAGLYTLSTCQGATKRKGELWMGGMSVLTLYCSNQAKAVEAKDVILDLAEAGTEILMEIQPVNVQVFTAEE